MTDTKQQVERRKHKRFPVTKDAFVAVRPAYLKLGRVTDIGPGGLTFRYIAGEHPSDLSSQLDIFLASQDFYLDKVPFRTISDFHIDGIPFSSVKIRRTGVQFGDLTPDQKAHLEDFIQDHTNGEEKV
jgi:hypothetical protein